MMDNLQKFDALNVSSKFAICGLPIRENRDERI